MIHDLKYDQNISKPTKHQQNQFLENLPNIRQHFGALPSLKARCGASLHGKDLLSRVPDLARPGTGLRREAGCAWETQELNDEHVTVRLVVLPTGKGTKLPAAGAKVGL